MNIYVSSVCFFFRMSKCSHFFTHVVKSISKSIFFCFLDFEILNFFQLVCVDYL